MLRTDLENDENVVWIGTEWVVTSRGSNFSLVIRARLVGQEFSDNTMRGELFAGPPGLTAMRYLICVSATS